LSNSEPSISQEISTATGNSTSIRTSAAYTPPGPSFQSSHTLSVLGGLVEGRPVFSPETDAAIHQAAKPLNDKIQRLGERSRGRSEELKKKADKLSKRWF